MDNAIMTRAFTQTGQAPAPHGRQIPDQVESLSAAGDAARFPAAKAARISNRQQSTSPQMTDRAGRGASRTGRLTRHG